MTTEPNAQNTLITGGAGFIGTHLARALVAQGRSVRVLDRAEPSNRVAGVTYIRGDIRRRTDLMKALDDIHHVFHLAAIVSVPECEAFPEESWTTNLEGTLTVARTLVETSHVRPSLVFASSCAVYGNTGGSAPITETSKPLPLSIYARQKHLSEGALTRMEQEGLRSRILRFFNVYGPGQRSDSPYSGVIAAFKKRALEGRKLELHGGGNQTRDFVHVHDVVTALIAASEAQSISSQAVNIGTGVPIRVKDLATLVGKALGKQLNLESTRPRDGDIEHSCADVGRARSALNWQPTVALEKGLRDLLLFPNDLS